MSENKNRKPPDSGPDQPQDTPNGTATDSALPADELLALRARAAERDQFLDMLQRTRAEFENYQKRNQREREQERRYQYGPFIYDLLPVLDNLRRAVNAAQQAGEKGSLIQGVMMVQTQLLDLLKRYGVTPIEAEGQPFNPSVHEAIAQQPAPPGIAPNTILQVVEQGFMNQDRVLRPARVVVAQG
ncbi:MAG: nucleotide exchange factor GrpE [Gemmataceae bacterium]|nr:nucleotide exchange factor GrpE [Gemmataceae bacterium]